MKSASGTATTSEGRADRLARARHIADGVTAEAAAAVDRDARFPSEAIAGLRENRLLAALVPAELGGPGCSFTEAGLIVEVLAGRCASTAMIYAMHQIQLSCLVRHGRSRALRDFTAAAAADQLLLASATTEAGTGGDIRSSRCAVKTAAGAFTLEKSAPVISYGEHADAVLATARRSGSAATTDQVLAVCSRPGLELTASSEWDALGMRGTCSPGFLLRAHGPADLVLDDPFGDILAQTMLPVSHALWASVWLGIATEAVTRARRYIQAQARREHGHTPRGAVRLAAVVAKQQQFRALVRGATAELDRTQPGRLATIPTAIAMNSLKLSAAALVVDIAGQALLTTGMAGYRDHGPYSMGRLLRDAYSASIMVNDDRITDNTAQLLLVSRETAP